jgi:hypothetical protein
MDWQPMSTAPKDGTWILGINNRGNCAVIIWSEKALDQDRFLPGWIHPFSTGEMSVFWNGANGSVPVAWASLPHDDDARQIVRRFEPSN